eukprot:gnl/Spiro4/11770_TR6213_c0_g1_i1.p1 gnl/Spiro4/11770_TR6213_c0_g1~~gnl/Spiro4/11770_TR6213_c0_g1_i1.p1  ORF type:complete len:229 (+),score=36.92 gnl/Spiro4/11770_TR6213_c0_g1_i1:49-687(+)
MWKCAIVLVLFLGTVFSVSTLTDVTAYAPGCDTSAGYRPSFWKSNTIQREADFVVLAMYNAVHPFDSPRGHIVGTTHVTVTGSSTRPIVLLMTSYEATHWIVNSSVPWVGFTGSYYSSQCSITSIGPVNQSAGGGSSGSYLPYDGISAGGRFAGADALAASFNTAVRAYAGCYAVSDFLVTAVDNTPRSDLASGVMNFISNLYEKVDEYLSE